MAKVYVVNDGIEIEIPDGSLVGEIDGKCSILFACHEGTCGSCLSTIKEGMENLEEPNETEKAALESFGAQPNQRLLCITKIKKGRIVVEQ